LKTFLVVVHDVTPRFADKLSVILESLTDLLGSRFACAVVPQWHGEAEAYRQHEASLWRSVDRCDELLAHGWTHQRTKRPGMLSRLTNRSDEFGGLTLTEIQSRIDKSQHDLWRIFGVQITGLVPPAWQLPVNSRDLRGITHVLRWSRLESQRGDGLSIPLATWSYDWGRLAVPGFASHAMAMLMKKWPGRSTAIPTVVIHPADLSRGFMPLILSTIRAFMEAGLEPTTSVSLIDRMHTQMADPA
jgi:hypothetical protein